MGKGLWVVTEGRGIVERLVVRLIGSGGWLQESPKVRVVMCK